MKVEGKRIIFFLLCFCFLLFTFSLPSRAAELKAIQKRGYLIVAVKDNLRPLGFGTRRGR